MTTMLHTPSSHDAAELLASLTRAGVTISIDGDRLHVADPGHVVTPEIRADIATAKLSIMALLAVAPVAPVAPSPVVLSLDELWSELQRLGVTIARARDGQLSARPASAVTPAMLAALREHKVWIGEYMAASALDSFPPVFADVDAAVISEEVAARIARHPFVYRPELEPMPDMVPLPEPEPEPVIWRYSWNPGG
ncbi:MAG TPA: hypothetical protein VF120_09745, partial [Ktedonobacterales bacterium]